MEKSETHGGRESGHDASAHQHSEISISAVVKFLAILFVSAAVVDVLMLGMLKGLQYQHEREEVPPPAMFVTEQQKLPPEPRLQGAPGSQFQLQDPALDVQAYDKEQKQKLESYGWVDQSKGQVRIPIQEAMKRVLQQGLPTKPTSSAQPAATQPAVAPAAAQPAGTQPPAAKPRPSVQTPPGAKPPRPGQSGKE